MQIQQASTINRQAMYAREPNSLTPDLHLSLCSPALIPQYIPSSVVEHLWQPFLTLSLVVLKDLPLLIHTFKFLLYPSPQI